MNLLKIVVEICEMLAERCFGRQKKEVNAFMGEELNEKLNKTFLYPFLWILFYMVHAKTLLDAFVPSKY